MTTCESVQRAVWSRDVTDHVAAHIETCPACRLESSRSGRLSAALASLQTSLADPPPHLEAAILAALPASRLDRARRVVAHPWFARAATLGAAAASATAFGVIVARRLSRPELPELAG